MSKPLHRRDVLKLLALLPLAELARALPAAPRAPRPQAQRPNVLILVFDALSAHNVSFLGYPRDTTPHLARFADQATVYHAHYAAGNFTNPGTASLLTGTYPWTHRALQLYAPVLRRLQDRNLFGAFAPGGYHRVAYSHNMVATTLIHGFRDAIDDFMKTRELCLLDDQLSDRLFFNDYDVAFWRERLFWSTQNLPIARTSLLISNLNRVKWLSRRRAVTSAYEDQFPRGLPNLYEQIFRLEDTVDWLRDHLPTLPQPYLAYFHLLPPHDPYNPRREFIGAFDDAWVPTPKPPHAFSQGFSQEKLNTTRRHYDEFVAYADAEFGRLYDALQNAGVLDDTYLVVTSDHGEMFERGIIGHSTEALCDPVVQVPLLIAAPGQRTRQDVHMPTSSVDVMPTLLHATGQPIPTGCEGELLPPWGEPAADRNIFVVEAKQNPKFAPLTKASLALIRGEHKLIHYRGYPGLPNTYELYNLAEDPQELDDLYTTERAVAAALQRELEAHLQAADRPYET
jgi:arylsulfatase A-like enzyme